MDGRDIHIINRITIKVRLNCISNYKDDENERVKYEGQLQANNKVEKDWNGVRSLGENINFRHSTNAII